jgi:hypothetical protein
MKTILISICMLLQASGSTQQDVLNNIFDLARKHDSIALARLARSEEISGNSLYRNALNVARYIADPSRYEQRFVETFPQDMSGIMSDLYEQIELTKRTPEFLFSFKSLGAIARRGSSAAVRKLFGAITVADGVVGEQLCEDANWVLTKRSKLAVESLSMLSPSTRTKVYSSCLALLDRDEKKRMKESLSSIKPSDTGGRETLRELRRALHAK